MEFIGYTAGIDAVLVLIALITLSVRRAKVEAGMTVGKMTHFFQSYLIFTFCFLVLIALAMLRVTGSTQQIVLIVADLALWTALSYMVCISFIGSSSSAQKIALTVLLVPAGLTTLYQLGKLTGMLTDAGALTWLFENMAAVLMYAVWIPVAISFLNTAMRSTDSVIRMRSVMFALGLLLTTLSWVSRLQLGVASLSIISAMSIIGFVLLVSGVAYRGRPMTAPSPAPAL